MKMRIAVLLCTAALMLSAVMPQAMAAQQHYPVTVESYVEGDIPYIRKVYQLSLSDNPAGISTENFERDGRLYYLQDMTRRDEVGVDTKTYTQTVTMDSDTGELSEVLKRLDGQIEAATEDGYTGVLLLDHTSVKVEVKGYATSTKNLSASRTYPNLSDADVSLIPKSITENGRTLTLADVQWSGDGTHYTATASYTGSATSRYASGYTVSANYTGEVAKTNCEVVTYTAIFGSMELPETQESRTALEVSPEPAGSGVSLPALLGCAGGAAALLAAGLWTAKKMKERRA